MTTLSEAVLAEARRLRERTPPQLNPDQERELVRLFGKLPARGARKAA